MRSRLHLVVQQMIQCLWQTDNVEPAHSLDDFSLSSAIPFHQPENTSGPESKAALPPRLCPFMDD